MKRTFLLISRKFGRLEKPWKFRTERSKRLKLSLRAINRLSGKIYSTGGAVRRLTLRRDQGSGVADVKFKIGTLFVLPTAPLVEFKVGTGWVPYYYSRFAYECSVLIRYSLGLE